MKKIKYNLNYMEDKLTQLKLYSVPQKVIQNIKKYLGNNIKLFVSSRKNKKYMIKDPETNTWIHFGEMGMEDYTLHQDEKRRDNFKKRNAKWAKSDKFTPAYLSYFLLW